MSCEKVIWDLDNCLSDDSWRLSYIDWRADSIDARYGRYHRLCVVDEPGNVETFHRWLSLGAQPLFVTGRPESVRQHTLTWIAARLGIERPRLLMRAARDHRPSERVKRDLLVNSGELAHGRIVCAYDDHPPIVKMYQDEFNIRAVELSIHSRCAYTNPFTTKAKQ